MSWFTKRDPYTSRRQKVLWWQPPHGYPETAKGLNAWLKTNPILFGEITDGEKWHREQALAFLKEFEGGTMLYVNEKFGKQDVFNSRTMFVPDIARAARAPLGTSRSSSASHTFFDNRGHSIPVSRESQLLSVRARFSASPFGTDVDGLRPEAQHLLRMMRLFYEKALCYFCRVIVCPRLEQVLSSAFQHNPSMGWADIKIILLEDMKDEQLRFYHEQLAVDLRNDGEQVKDWLRRYEAIVDEHLRLILDGTVLEDKGIRDMSVHYRCMVLDYALGQCSREERKLMHVPANTADYARLTFEILQQRAAKLGSGVVSVFRRRMIKSHTKRMLQKPTMTTTPPKDDKETKPPKNPKPPRPHKKKVDKPRAKGGVERPDPKFKPNSTQKPPTAGTGHDRKPRPPKQECSREVRILYNAMCKRAKEGKCVRCGGDGHILKNCPVAKPPNEAKAFKVGRIMMIKANSLMMQLHHPSDE